MKSNFILPNEGFQTSINIDLDLGDEKKIENLVVTNTVSRYLEELLHDVMLPSNQRAKVLVGAYGKGKSHIVLAALYAMWKKGSKACVNIAKQMRKRNFAFATSFEQFADTGEKLLPVIVSGNSRNLQRDMLYSLKNALKTSGLDALMSDTNFDSAINTIRRWKNYYPETFEELEKITGESGKSIIQRLKKMDPEAYNIFFQAYPCLTAGSTFEELEGANAINVFVKVAERLKKAGYDGIYVVYDEFSKYLETNIADTSSGDIRFLQDFAELCNRSEQESQMHMLLISHKSFENYIETKLSKAKIDGWRGVSGRFKEVVMIDDFSQYYELIECAIRKNKREFKQWLSRENQLRLRETYERFSSLFTGIQAKRIYEGCCPLHPLSTYLLPRMSERVAQNERTLFTFLCGTEEAALPSLIKRCSFYVMPDNIYDYFEPQLKREFYTSPLHKIYELTRTSLSRVSSNSLEARIIKTIALLDVIAQYDNVAPTRETIVSLFKDDGFTHNEVIQAIENLAEVQSIIYLRRSNSYLKLKESSGISIDSAITERVKKLKIEYALEDLLNFMLQGRALYPSGYNDEHRIVRYFTCKFITLPQFNNLELNSVVDGEVLAFLPDNPDEINKGVVEARRATENHKTLVVAVPKKYHEICDEVYRLKAAIQLKEEAEDDSVLKEEYEIVIEDMREIVDGFIGLYFQPELRGVFYIEGGKKRNKINRKHHLSKLLSSVCDKAFPYTPYITSEALNKNELTGTAFASRSKILNTICLCKDKDTINFDGRGQEYSMMRSALVATGLAKSGNQTKIESDIKRVISYIESFFNAASGDSFVTIYNELTERHNGIGMRKGPIPIYLAWVMKDYEEEIKVTHNGEEKTICGALFDDISKCPGEYFVYRINWTPQMAIYTTGLAVLFNCTGEKKTRNEVASAIMRWYIELPRVTRNATVDYSSVSGCKEISTIRKKFFNLLKRIDLDADEILFDKLPTLFGCTQLTGDLLERIAKEKRDCDNYLDNVKNALIKKTIEIFEPGAPNEASLGSVLHGWIENNPDVNIVVLDGVENQLVKAMIKAAGNDKIIIEQLAKTATALRIEDWNDQRFSDFLFLVESIKDKVENEPKTKNKLLSANCITINFTDDQGKDASRIFNRVKCGGRADILRSQLRSALEDMGGSMQDEEKRQVLFDVLMELC